MQDNPFDQWRSLTALYSEMSDGELLALAVDLAGLTEMAQQVLRDEMRKRQLDIPRPPSDSADNAYRLAAERCDAAVDPPISQDAIEESDLPHEYTWKTLLCECDEREEAWQIYEVLRLAGIESWIEGPRFASDPDATSPRVMVAADQLDQARAIASGPIPQDIIDQSRIELPEFDPPPCPSCRAEDPVLESVDPVNTWRCEICGMEWTEPAGDLTGSPSETQVP
jgi:hypothetical protein